MLMKKIFAALLALSFLTIPVVAVEPSEMLDDPVLEARARHLSTGLRCLVCQNESIDASDAGLAKDLRILLRERLVAGDSDDQAVGYIVSKYGEYVLLKPRFALHTLFLWLGPFVLLAIGITLLTLRARASRVAAPAVEADLSEAEKKRLKDLI